MKTILANFARHIAARNGQGIARQMASCTHAAAIGQITASELDQLKATVHIMTQVQEKLS